MEGEDKFIVAASLGRPSSEGGGKGATSLMAFGPLDSGRCQGAIVILSVLFI